MRSAALRRQKGTTSVELSSFAETSVGSVAIREVKAEVARKPPVMQKFLRGIPDASRRANCRVPARRGRHGGRLSSLRFGGRRVHARCLPGTPEDAVHVHRCVARLDIRGHFRSYVSLLLSRQSGRAHDANRKLTRKVDRKPCKLSFVCDNNHICHEKRFSS
jgi:hypothetical protein